MFIQTPTQTTTALDTRPGIPTSLGAIAYSRPAHEQVIDLQEEYENNNYYKALDPEDFAIDRGWLYHCRVCDQATRVQTRVPRCRHCGFSQESKPMRSEGREQGTFYGFATGQA